MTNSKYVPKRRFKEFVGDGEWEQNQLKELAEFSKGRGYSKSELQTDGQPIILYGRLYTKYETVISTVDTFTHIKENSVLSKGGEVLVPSSGESAEDIARASVVAEEGIIIGGDLNIIKLCKKIEPIFLSLAISNGKQKEEISKRAQGKSVVHVNNDDLKQVNVLFPSISEQIQIGKFFQTIDALISNHQHKLDKLKDMKKAYLTEMFPAEGERVPKRRFPGFEGEWERRKVSELFKITRGYVLAATRTESNKSKTTPYPVYSSQTKDKGLMGFYSKYLYEDAITWTTDGANAGEVNFREGKFYCTNVCGVLLSKEVQADPMIAEAINNIAKNYVSYVGNPKLMNNVMAEIEISIPQTSSEREKISHFFSNIDKQIFLQQQKLDKLNDLKKAYLNELFV